MNPTSDPSPTGSTVLPGRRGHKQAPGLSTQDTREGRRPGTAGREKGVLASVSAAFTSGSEPESRKKERCWCNSWGSKKSFTMNGVLECPEKAQGKQEVKEVQLTFEPHGL